MLPLKVQVEVGVRGPPLRDDTGLRPGGKINGRNDGRVLGAMLGLRSAAGTRRSSTYRRSRARD